MKIRPERVAHLIRREIAEILSSRLRDPRVSHWVSVTDVELSGDLSFARVFVSVLASGPECEQTLEALERATPFVRRELAPRLGLREVPGIRFVLDPSIERGARVEDLLRKLSQGEPIDPEGEEGEEA
ncbi:MAG: 30S ribosome-binding factor RbfA [Candidatus Eisenbacteria bacterium]|uniref:Ribosome-binding factor A n=1 Tax=Eiseniibacteriota bacterium TaxID=2212470 RepID=A0A538SGS3_UNCEI|nr:MAG: 30S ribosome-binding factor RbfA [Candidatus Eisenbacteria bacterium]